jgi:nucleotide-binding universal stress UspA family protein
MFNRILVPVDGSSFAEAAVPAAISLAGRSGGEVHLLRVLESPPPDVMPQFDPPDRESARAYLQALAQSTDAEPPTRVSFSVREGAPVDQIANAAREWRADLVVMSTHGRGGVSRLWLGSVADRFLRGAALPVLLIRPPERQADAGWPFRVERVVTPLDGSTRAESALPWASSLARAFDAPLVLVQAIVYPGAPEIDWPGGGEIVETAEQEARSYLEEVRRRVSTNPANTSIRVIRSPGAAQVALQEADGNPIVIASRGRSQLGRMFLGSVADKVIRGATGPVAVIPAGGGG